ncbi:MAG: hypothetical protein KAS32_28720 [Candidatus Peribacteraceae bacterium]|nr:hypothetical protein [Candidatus Peribacteraceae bacterium]
MVKLLSDIKEGNWVWSIKNGWEIVKHISRLGSGDIHMITTENGDRRYSMEGIYSTDIYPSLWTYNPFDKNDTPPYAFKKGEVIFVWDNDSDEERGYRTFIEMEGKYFKCDYTNDSNTSNTLWDNARPLTNEESGR